MQARALLHCLRTSTYRRISDFICGAPSQCLCDAKVSGHFQLRSAAKSLTAGFLDAEIACRGSSSFTVLQRQGNGSYQRASCRNVAYCVSRSRVRGTVGWFAVSSLVDTLHRTLLVRSTEPASLSCLEGTSRTSPRRGKWMC